MTTPGESAPDGAYVLASTYGSDITEESAKAIMKSPVIGSYSNGQGIFQGIIGGITAFFSGFATVVDAIIGTVNDEYLAAQPIINDHSHSITEIQDALDVLVLQGQSIKYITNGTYTPSAGITAVEVIALGAGAGGAAGRWDVLPGNRRSGGGGGGGGEVHYTIPAALLPMTGGVFDSIAITVGAFGSGGTGDGSPGVAGGNTSFGSFLEAGGGVGGVAATPTAAIPAAAGGAGMIPGGAGGVPAYSSSGTPVASTGGANSVSQFSLNGGGGGGGAGFSSQGSGSTGGQGGISPGGTYGGGAGSEPSAVVATGGGGGGGGGAGQAGGNGGYPAGGGGGGGANSSSPKGNGGNGGAGALYIIERSGDVVGL